MPAPASRALQAAALSAVAVMSHARPIPTAGSIHRSLRAAEARDRAVRLDGRAAAMDAAAAKRERRKARNRALADR